MLKIVQYLNLLPVAARLKNVQQEFHSREYQFHVVEGAEV